MTDLSWSTERRRISDLVPHPLNPRKLTDAQAQTLKDSLERFNLAEIPAINTDNTILAGHQRLKVMAMLGRGEEVIEVRVPSRTLSPSEASEYLIRSNKNTGEWDFEGLEANFELNDLIGWGFESWELPFALQPDQTFRPANLIQTDAEGANQRLVTCPSCGLEFSPKTNAKLGRQAYEKSKTA
jgi:hypothetical protein